MNKTYEAVIYLMACALNSSKVDERKLQGVDLEELLTAAQNHTVAAMVCFSLEKTDTYRNADPKIRKRWTEVKEKAIYKNIMLDAAREKLFLEFEKRGIWYAPLKGSILKDYYPVYGMRQMSDNDILFDASKRAEVRNLFEQFGYETVSFEKYHHDTYQKAPIYNFEMHVSLFSSSACPEAFERFKNVKERLIQDEGKTFGYHFSPEDFYLHVVGHAYKHYSRGGTGIRTLADFFILNKRFGGNLNRQYIADELMPLHMVDFERESRVLAEKIFSPNSPMSLTLPEQEMLDYYIGSSTYGNIHNRVHNELMQIHGGKEGIGFWTKCHYILQRVFPGRDFCKEAYPFFYRHPSLLPFFWMWRILYRVPKSKNRIQKELGALKL